MPGVTEQEIAQAKQMNLYQYMQLCEPDNFKPEGPGQFRHKGHSSLTFAADGSWTYFKTKAISPQRIYGNTAPHTSFHLKQI